MEWNELRAADLMQRELLWAEPTNTLRQAVQRMDAQKLRCLLVKPPANGSLPGILTSKDLVNLASTQGPKILDQFTVGEVMSRPAVCVPSQTTIPDCLQLMRLTGVRRLPVLDGTDVVGLISSTDVFHALARTRAAV